MFLLKEKARGKGIAVSILLFLTAVHAKFNYCGPNTVFCICKYGEFERVVSVKLNNFITDVNNARMIIFNVNGTFIKCPDPHEACAKIFCSLKNETSELNNIPPFSLPRRFRIPTDSSTDRPSGLRVKRGSEGTGLFTPCKVEPMKTASIDCSEWPEFTGCNITCLDGYAFEVDGKSVKSNVIGCKKTEKKWKPHQFRECKPYWNCKAVLTEAGYMKCRDPLVSEPYCDIKCWDYDKKAMTDSNRYVCTNGVFNPPLPYCAGLKKMTLIKPPE